MEGVLGTREQTEMRRSRRFRDLYLRATGRMSSARTLLSNLPTFCSITESQKGGGQVEQEWSL